MHPVLRLREEVAAAYVDCPFSPAPALHLRGGRLVLLLLTPFVLLRTPTDIFPAINIPVVSIVWQYTGLDAQEIEQRILYNHERALTATVNDIEHIESTAYNGIGVIKVFFRQGASVDAGVAQITAIAQTILRPMPPGTTPPLIIRYSASTVPILQYSISSPKLSEQEIFDLTANQIRVGLATVQGAVDALALRRQDARGVGGPRPDGAQGEEPGARWTWSTPSTPRTSSCPAAPPRSAAPNTTSSSTPARKVLEELDDLPIKTVNGAVIRVRDVAQVRDGYQPQQNIVRQDGVRGALLTIFKTGAASTLDVVGGVKAALPRILQRPAAGPGREGVRRPIHLRPRGHLRRGPGRRHRRRADGVDDPAVPRLVAQHAHHRALHPAVGAHLHRHPQRAGRDHQPDDPGRAGAGGRHPGGRRDGEPSRTSTATWRSGKAAGRRPSWTARRRSRCRPSSPRSASASCSCRCSS